MSHDTIAIVGLGLMGSSLGLSIEHAYEHRLGVDEDPLAAAQALDRGAVDEVGALAAMVSRADVVVLAVPVRAAIDLAPRIAAAMRSGAVLTDLGSTKRSICTTFDALSVAAIGGHPMCGSERSGPAAAQDDLFHGAVWAVCAAADADPTAIDAVTKLIRAAGATPLRVDAAAHDRAAATASHLPFVTATALVGALTAADAATDQLASRLAATGFRDATRLAHGNAVMWDDILATNADYVRVAITSLRDELAAIEARLPQQ